MTISGLDNLRSPLPDATPQDALEIVTHRLSLSANRVIMLEGGQNLEEGAPN